MKRKNTSKTITKNNKNKKSTLKQSKDCITGNSDDKNNNMKTIDIKTKKKRKTYIHMTNYGSHDKNNSICKEWLLEQDLETQFNIITEKYDIIESFSKNNHLELANEIIIEYLDTLKDEEYSKILFKVCGIHRLPLFIFEKVISKCDVNMLNSRNQNIMLYLYYSVEGNYPYHNYAKVCDLIKKISLLIDKGLNLHHVDDANNGFFINLLKGHGGGYIFCADDWNTLNEKYKTIYKENLKNVFKELNDNIIDYIIDFSYPSEPETECPEFHFPRRCTIC